MERERRGGRVCRGWYADSERRDVPTAIGDLRGLSGTAREAVWGVRLLPAVESTWTGISLSFKQMGRGLMDTMDSLRKMLTAVRSDSVPRILVLGDLILDRYTWGNATRISPEAPIVLLEAIGSRNG